MKIHIKPKYIVAFLCIAALVIACSLLASGPDSNTAADSEYVTVGSDLTVHNTDSRLTLFSNMETLSANGLYYASWTAGGSEPYVNIDGDTVDLYDAQLHLLLGEFKSSDTAQENLDAWYDIGSTNYDITDKKTVTCNGQPYTMVIYNLLNEEDPYARGVSAFGVNNTTAVCAELTCRENYHEDLEEMLTEFLNNFDYK